MKKIVELKDASIAELEQSLRESEASCAAMRDALVWVRNLVCNAWKERIDSALSTTAGAPMLARLQSLQEHVTKTSRFFGPCSAHRIPDKDCETCNPMLARIAELEADVTYLLERSSATTAELFAQRKVDQARKGEL